MTFKLNFASTPQAFGANFQASYIGPDLVGTTRRRPSRRRWMPSGSGAVDRQKPGSATAMYTPNYRQGIPGGAS
jgi:hypothetical protein